MITTEFYEGQGLGNQLWSYASLLAIAKKCGFEYGFQSIKRFKGLGLFNLDFGNKVYGVSSNGPGIKLNSATRYWYLEPAKIHPVDGGNLTGFDPKVFEIRDCTKIDGYFQCEDLILPIKADLLDQLQIFDFHQNSSNRCIINLRGGEYVYHKELFLGHKYYQNAVNYMLEVNPNMQFAVVTDDTLLAKEFFPKFPILSANSLNFDAKGRETFDQSKAALDFGILQSATYLILSNSSFSWWGAWTNNNARLVIAPKYWARHNISDGYWSLGESLTRNWLWLNKDGEMFSYEDCFEEKMNNPGTRSVYKEDWMN
jgi:hypothetical protein